MKNLIAIFILMTLSSVGILAQDAYQKAMTQAIAHFRQAETSTELQKAVNQFQRIAGQKPNEWLPYYYQALALGRMSFMDQVKGDELADEAQKILDLAKPLVKDAKDKAEVETLQGFIYTAKLVVDPMSRGQMYSALSGKAYQTALTLDATNPRAKLMQIRGKMGAAQFFKQDLTPFIKETQELLKVWDNFKPKSNLYPNWGKQMAMGIAYPKAKPTAIVPAEASKAIESVPTASVTSKDGYSVAVLITGLRNDKGVVRIALQDDQKKSLETRKVTISGHQAQTTFEGLPAGQYAIKFQHDENEDGKLNFGFMHIPSEGYGYSNNARGTMGPPDFKKTLFTLSGNTKLELTTKYH